MPPVNLYDSLLERLEGHPYSHYFSTWCINDEHQSPALLVFDDGLAKCLSCNKVWTHAQLDKKIGSHFLPRRNDTVSRILPQWKKWEEQYGDLEGITYYANKTLKRFKQFQTYFKERKIFDFVDDGRLGYLDGWFVFPVYDANLSIIDLVVRSTKKHSDIRYVIHPRSDGSRPLYVPCWKKVLEAEVVYCVYGLIDAISLHLAGLPSVTGVTGKSLSPELLRPLNKRFMIVPDAGEEVEAHKLANQLGWRAKVKQVNYSKFEREEIKDPDSIRRVFGNQVLLQSISA